jgi:hypothetical protein
MNRFVHSFIHSVLLAGLISLVVPVAVSAAAVCDITDLPCWGKGSKCNIKFSNNTGKASGSGGGTGYRQYSAAATTKVKAVKENGNRAGKNSLEILAGATGTLNLDKKSNFNGINIVATTIDGTPEVTLTCEQVRQVLAGSGKCKLFITGSSGKMAFNCDRANVTGKGD